MSRIQTASRLEKGSSRTRDLEGDGASNGDAHVLREMHIYSGREKRHGKDRCRMRKVFPIEGNEFEGNLLKAGLARDPAES